MESRNDRYAWAEAGPEDVGGGIYRIPLPLPGDALTAVNVYAIIDPGGVDLIDAGQALVKAREALVQALRKVGCELGDVRNLFITHIHRDHYTLAPELRRDCGAAISLGEAERENLRAIHEFARRGTERSSVANLHRTGADEIAARLRELEAVPQRDIGQWAEPDHWLADRVEIELPGRTLRAIHTPGHTRGHLVFHDAAGGLLFSGDHVLPHITPSIGFEPKVNRQALSDYMGSLRLLLTLPEARLLPAHGPVAPSTHDRLAELLAHHEARLDQILRAAAAGSVTAYDVARAIDWTRKRRAFTELDLFNQMLATNETAMHLEVLVARAALTRTTTEDGIDRYLLPTP